MGLKTKLRPRISARLRKNKQIINKNIDTLENSISFTHEEEDIFFGVNANIYETLKDNLKTANLMSDTFSRGNALSYGVRIAFIGKPNVGKSTLVNKLIGIEKSIISDVPGTTRDIISTEIVMAGIPVTLIDTAGIHLSKNKVEISFSDISKEALEVCKKNIKKHKVNRYSKILNQDLYGKDSKKYDLIVSNPPYVSKKDFIKLEKNIINFEPRLALISDKNGIYHLEKIILESQKNLKIGDKISEELPQIDMGEL